MVALTCIKACITLGFPRFALGYELGATVKELAPDRSMFHINDREEFAPLFFAKLDGIGVERIRQKLQQISQYHGGRDLALLCFEDVRKPGEWCHRQVFAIWYMEQTGELIEELPEPGGTQLSLML